jgi:hypothetical protein
MYNSFFHPIFDPTSALFSRSGCGQLGLVSARDQRSRPAPRPAVQTMPSLNAGVVRFEVVVEEDIEHGNSKGDQLGDHESFARSR